MADGKNVSYTGGCLSLRKMAARVDAKGGALPYLYTGETNGLYLLFWKTRRSIPRDVTHVRVDPSVKVIDSQAFIDLEKLEEVDLCDGVERIESGAFYNCKSLQHVKIPSSVKVIEANAFFGCKSLQHVKIPSSVKVIARHTFSGCDKLEVVEFYDGRAKIDHGAFCRFIGSNTFYPLFQAIIGKEPYCNFYQPDDLELRGGIEQIEMSAFNNCSSLKHVRIPSTVKEIGKWSFCHCKQLVSVELGEGVNSGEYVSAFESCFSLRNIVIPSMARCLFNSNSYDLQKLFGSLEKTNNALKRRFDGLPIHKLCYYQSHYPSEVVLEQLQNLSGLVPDQSGALPNNNQDCLGMTPLHILACSTKQNLDLYQLIVAKQPKNLITEDRWGCLPILYAIWVNASQEIIQFLIVSQKSAFPDLVLNWEKMIETLCRAGVSLQTLQLLLGIKFTSYPEFSIDWQNTAQELTIHCLVRCGSFEDFPSNWVSMMEAFSSSRIHEGLIQNLLAIQHTSFPGQNDTNWQIVCEEFAKPLRGWWVLQYPQESLKIFLFLVKCDIAGRLNTIRVRNWRIDIENSVKGLSSMGSFSNIWSLTTILCKLVIYERKFFRVKESTFLLELALWKYKIDKSFHTMVCTNMSRGDNSVGQTAHIKGQCRINCGADIIIPNVLPFLIYN